MSSGYGTHDLGLFDPEPMTSGRGGRQPVASAGRGWRDAATAGHARGFAGWEL